MFTTKELVHFLLTGSMRFYKTNFFLITNLAGKSKFASYHSYYLTIVYIFPVYPVYNLYKIAHIYVCILISLFDYSHSRHPRISRLTRRELRDRIHTSMVSIDLRHYILSFWWKRSTLFHHLLVLPYTHSWSALIPTHKLILDHSNVTI